jgi:hypothetical protein
MVNAWMAHVKSVSAGNKGKSLKEILKMASKTYKKSPATHVATKHKKHKKHKKHHSTKRHHKKRKRGRRGRKKQRGGEHNTDIAETAGAAAPASTEGGNAGTALAGSDCPVPAVDGSGSTSQALLRGCGSLPNACNAFIGGKRKRKSKRKKSRRKKRKTRRKSRKRRRKRKSKRGGGCNGEEDH